MQKYKTESVSDNKEFLLKEVPMNHSTIHLIKNSSLLNYASKINRFNFSFLKDLTIGSLSWGTNFTYTYVVYICVLVFFYMYI